MAIVTSLIPLQVYNKIHIQSIYSAIRRKLKISRKLKIYDVRKRGDGRRKKYGTHKIKNITDLFRELASCCTTFINSLQAVVQLSELPLIVTNYRREIRLSGKQKRKLVVLNSISQPLQFI